jgi:membrane protein YqaA with SNARE-associated domain
MLRRLYDWALSLAGRKSAEWWLAFIAFVESSVFVIPAEVLFVPMGLARPERVWRYAVIATVTSVAGGVFGWFLGHYAYEYVAKPMLAFYGSLAKFEELRGQASGNFEFLVLILVTSSLAHLPPMKVVSIASGAIGVNL